MERIKSPLCSLALASFISMNLYAGQLYTLKNMTLKEALEKISKESKLSYIVDETLIAGKVAPNIKNVEGVKNALNKVLNMNGLEAVIENGTIIIKKRKQNSKKDLSLSYKNKLDDLVVLSASRTNILVDKSPVSVKVINKEEIENQLNLTSNSSEILGNLISSYSPSRQKMNGNGETIRGRTPLILIDGIPQTNALRPTGREAHTIDFRMVDNIEVINGATSTNGISGVGGVINIITKKPEKNKVSQTIDMQTTIPTSGLDSDTASYRLGYSISGASDNLDYYLSASFENQGLYLDGNGDAVGADNTQGDLMNSKSFDILTKLGYWFDDNQNVKLLVNKYKIKNDNDYINVKGDKDNRILATSIKGTPEGKAPFNDVLSSSLSYKNFDFFGMDLSAMVFNQRFESLFGATNSTSFQDINIAPIGTLYDQSRVKSTKYGSKFTLNKKGFLDNKLNVTFGFDTMFDETFQDLYLTNRTYVPKSNYDVYSPFILLSYALTDNLTLHGGVRYEKGKIKVESYTTVPRYNSVDVQGGDIDISEDLYNLGLVYDFKNGTNIYASYSEGFTLPDVGRALRSINTPGVNLSNFKNLEPIITDNYELGIRTKKGIFNFEASVYQSESDFGSRIVTNSFGQYVLNRQKTRIRGFDLGLGVKVNNYNNLNFLYSFSEGKYDSNNDGNLDAKLGGLNMAPNRLISKWYSKINDKLSTFLQVSHAFDRTFDDSSNNFSGYTLVDFSSSYKLNKGTLSLGISNLFDKQYVSYYSQSAVNDDTRYTAGRGRTVTLGYSLKF